jgi:tetratricopeptide (TPR) repeat protein
MDLLTGEEVQFVPGDFRYLGFEPTGALWTCSSAGFFRWPVRSSVGAPHRLRIGPPEWVANAQAGMKGSFNTDGRVAAVPMRNMGALVIHRGPSRRAVRLGPQYDVRGALPSPDGHWIVTGSHWYDNSGVKVKLWDADTGRLVANLPYPYVSNYSGFSPDSKWIYVTGRENRRLEIASLGATPLQADAPGAARWPEGWRSESAKSDGVFSPDNCLRALTTKEGVLRLVLPETGGQIARLPTPEVGTLESPAFSADGSAIAVRGLESGSVYVFDLRRIREQLADLGLDWTEAQPVLPARPGEDKPALAPPLEVELIDAEWATSHEKMNQYETERAAVRLFVNPFDGGAHYRLGGLLCENGQFADAIAHLTAALAFRPDLDNVHSLRAEAAFRLQRWDDAVADATLYLKKYPYDSLVRQIRALANRGRKHYDEAAADLTTVIENYAQLPEFYDQRAACYEALGKADLAAADRAKALKLATNHPERLNDQAWILVTGPARLRDPAKALALIQLAVELQRDDANLLNTLGVVQYRNAKFAEAVATLEKSLARNEGKFDAFDLFFLAMCHKKLGQADQAKDCFDRAVLWTQQRRGQLEAQQVQQLAAFRAEAEAVLKEP